MLMDAALFAQYEDHEVELESIHGNQNQTAYASNSSSIEDQSFQQQLWDQMINQLFQVSYIYIYYVLLSSKIWDKICNLWYFIYYNFKIIICSLECGFAYKC